MADDGGRPCCIGEVDEDVEEDESTIHKPVVTIAWWWPPST
jgi:hypothetical protein